MHFPSEPDLHHRTRLKIEENTVICIYRAIYMEEAIGQVP